MTQLYTQFQPVIFIGLFFLIPFAFFLIHSRIAYWKKILIIPILVITFFIIFNNFQESLGKAYRHDLPSDFILIQYFSKDPIIEIWILEKSGHTRLYQVPYDPELQKKLKEAMERKKQTGIPQHGHYQPRKNSNTTAPGKWNFENLDISKIYPKESIRN